MIRFDQVSKRYPGSDDVLRGVSFGIEPGELVFVTGHSGAGKSTLLKLVAAIERPTQGTVLIGNQNISKLRPSALPYLRRRFGLVFQDHKLLYDRNCFDNVALPLYVNGVTGEDAARRIRAALDKVGLLGREKTMPITLSGEPTGTLDGGYAAEIMSLFYAFQQVGVTVIIATHDANRISMAGNKVLHLDHGRLESYGGQA